MSWATHHSKSERYASLAELAVRNGGLRGSLELYRRAAVEEALALSCLSKRKTQARGVTAVRVVALWLNAGNSRQARRVANQLVGEGSLPDFAVSQLGAMLIGNNALPASPLKGKIEAGKLAVGAKTPVWLAATPPQLTALTPNTNCSAVGSGDINSSTLVQFMSPPGPAPRSIFWWTAMTSDALRPTVLSKDAGNAVVIFKQGLTIWFSAITGGAYYVFMSGSIVDNGTTYPFTSEVVFISPTARLSKP